jgi:hypothetical protein
MWLMAPHTPCILSMVVTRQPGIVPMLVETAQAPIVTFDTGNPSEEISYR